MVNEQIKRTFKELEAKAKEMNLHKGRIELLHLIGIEAEHGCPFSDKIADKFPELIR